MIQQFDDICTLLRQIKNLAVIETSDDSTAQLHSLPAVIVDFEPGTIGPLTEDDEQLWVKASFSLSIHVEISPTRKAARKALNKLTKQIFSKITGHYGSVDWGTFYPQTVPFGNTHALAYGVLITLPEEEFILED